MTKTRREFLSQTAMAVALGGRVTLGGRVFRPGMQSKRPYLDLAIRCGDWIDRSTQQKSNGIAWPADPLKPAAIGLDYYNGTPGVVAFMAQLAHATGDAKWRERAQKGGEYLIAESERSLDRMNDGLYTGLAGLGATFATLSELGLGARWNDAAQQVTNRIVLRAKTVGDGVEWSGTNDIIGGTAGIGLFLLDVTRRKRNRIAEDFAVRAGRRLLRTGVPAEGGLMWFPGAGVKNNYPNFSHGTAGVAYLLATLYGASRDKAFWDGAASGAKYLDAVATRRNGARAIFHVTGGGEDRFYLSWCHGPVGTARLFYRLMLVMPNWEEFHWSQLWLNELTAWLVASGAPEQQSAGYWNNISQCCGNAGIGQYWIDLARHRRALPAGTLEKLRERVTTNTRSRATDDETGLRWVQAENRVSPDNLVAQTGFMQGAAGVGTFFLQLDAFARGQRWRAPWPDTPWA